MADAVLNRLKGAPIALQHWLLDEKRASYGLAVMRIGYGAMSLVLMAMYLPHLSYSFGEAAAWATPLREASAVNDYPWPLLSIFSRDDPDVVLFVKFALLAAVTLAFTLGWRMRITAPVFLVLWLSFSTINPVITNTGHYQTFRVMLIFMVFADLSRRWSLDALRRSRRGGSPAPRLAVAGLSWPPPAWLGALFNNAAVLLIGFQLCIIYVTSALWKLRGATWHSGVAVYYPLRLEELALFPELNQLVWSITPLVLLGSWASVYLQLFFPLLLLNRWTRIFALIAITGMHAAIGILLSLPFFSAMMIFADMIFVRSVSWQAAEAWLRRQRGRLRRPSARRREDDSAATEPVTKPASRRQRDATTVDSRPLRASSKRA